jgi:hypothetical protein
VIRPLARHALWLALVALYVAMVVTMFGRLHLIHKLSEGFQTAAK